MASFLSSNSSNFISACTSFLSPCADTIMLFTAPLPSTLRFTPFSSKISLGFADASPTQSQFSPSFVITHMAVPCNEVAEFEGRVDDRSSDSLLQKTGQEISQSLRKHNYGMDWRIESLSGSKTHPHDFCYRNAVVDVVLAISHHEQRREEGRHCSNRYRSAFVLDL